MITIPTIAEIYEDLISELEAELGMSIPEDGKNFLRALSAVLASKFKIYYLGTGAVQKNIFPDTADTELTGGTLERFGRVKLNRNPFPAQAAQYEIEITGEVGAVIPANSVWKSNDDSLNPGRLYILDSLYTLVASTDSITVRALDAGVVASLNDGDDLTATAPISGVSSDASVLSEVVEPKAAETTAEYRQKILESFRLEAQGGAASDYRLWAADAQGVAAVYPYAKSGSPAELNLYVEATIADSTDGKGTPSGSLLSDVEDVVNLDPDTTLELLERGRRPLTAIVNYIAVTPLDVTIDIADFVGLTAALQTSILEALTEKISEIRPFVAAADIAENKNDILDINKIIAVILTVKPGAIFGTVTLTVDGVPVNSYTFENGDIPYLDSVSYS